MLFDQEQARRWLEILHGGSPGLVHICGAGAWVGQTFPADAPEAAAAYAATLDDREGVYYRVSTVVGQDGPHRRGGRDQSVALPALWASWPGRDSPSRPSGFTVAAVSIRCGCWSART